MAKRGFAVARPAPDRLVEDNFRRKAESQFLQTSTPMP